MAGTHIRLTHGYEFFLMVGRNIEPGDIDMRQKPGGLYAVLRFRNLDRIGKILGTSMELDKREQI